MATDQIIKLENSRHVLEAINVDLSGSSFRDVNLASTSLDDVNLSGISIQNANLAGLKIRDVNLSGTSLEDVNLSALKIRDANLNGASISSLLTTPQTSSYSVGSCRNAAGTNSVANSFDPSVR